MKITKAKLKQIIKEELESPDDIIARYPSSRPGEPDQVIYRWQQDEFDDRQRAYKAFDKRTRGKEDKYEEIYGLAIEAEQFARAVQDEELKAALIDVFSKIAIAAQEGQEGTF
jgi:hypothetical protein